MSLLRVCKSSYNRSGEICWMYVHCTAVLHGALSMLVGDRKDILLDISNNKRSSLGCKLFTFANFVCEKLRRTCRPNGNLCRCQGYMLCVVWHVDNTKTLTTLSWPTKTLLGRHGGTVLLLTTLYSVGSAVRLCSLPAVTTVNATDFCFVIPSSDFVNFCTVS